MAILVYTPKFSPRIRYAFRLLLVEISGCDELSFTTDKEAFEKSEDTRINYSREAIAGTVQFFPAGLLNEKDIAEQNLFVEYHEDVPVFFTTSNSALPFDPFAAAFYLVTRYEEYLPFISDQHGRFPATESIAYKEKFLDKPVVNIWAKWLRQVILNAYPNQTFDVKPYRFITTVDVDNLYAYKGKGAFRMAGAILKDVFTFSFPELLKRLNTIFGFIPDVFDTFEKQIRMRDEVGAKSLYFMLFSEFAQYDRNISMHSPHMQEEVRAMSDFTEIGLHPSYQSNEDEKTVASEKRNLEDTLRTTLTKSRQHFLKMRLPDTIRHLADIGITDEYSMGYASEWGFRAGIATPFTFYDLEMEVALPITMHPFMLMDVTFIDYKGVPVDEALEKMKEMVDATRAVNGQLISVFHNRIFSEKEPQWTGWNELYRQFIRYAV